MNNLLTELTITVYQPIFYNMPGKHCKLNVYCPIKKVRIRDIEMVIFLKEAPHY